ncbi:hypothetical protein OH77DRAFT_1525780 [Trametes cingulata]|nr:hypothetical protein OH77DRAFT_1525780 [Trametes cingulata]
MAGGGVSLVDDSGLTDERGRDVATTRTASAVQADVFTHWAPPAEHEQGWPEDAMNVDVPTGAPPPDLEDLYGAEVPADTYRPAARHEYVHGANALSIATAEAVSAGYYNQQPEFVQGSSSRPMMERTWTSEYSGVLRPVASWTSNLDLPDTPTPRGSNEQRPPPSLRPPLRDAATVSGGVGNDRAASLANPDEHAWRSWYGLLGGSPAPRNLFTPVPDGGFARPNFSDPEALYEGLSRQRIADILNEPPNTLVLVQIFNVGMPPSAMVNLLMETLADAIRIITGHTDPLVIPLEPDWTIPPQRRRTPRKWVVLRLDVSSVERLVQRVVWSSPAITFFAYAREPVILRYLFTIAGFTRDRDHDIFRAVWRVFSGFEVRELILELIQANPEYAATRAEDAMNAILRSLTVRVGRLNSGNLVAAIYCSSPTRSLQRWRIWRDTWLHINTPRL